VTAPTPTSCAQDLPRRHLHVIGDGTERRFTRGQQRFFAQDFAGAVELLREAAARDPGYAGISCWLGMALSEAALAQGATGAAALEGADAAFARAIALVESQDDVPRESRAYDHMERGLAWLDAGRPDRARVHLEAARERDPDNALVQAGFDLLAWDEGQRRPEQVLLSGFDQRTSRHQARVLVRLATWLAEGASPGPQPLAPAEPGLSGWLEQRGRRRNPGRLSQAEALLAAGDGRGSVSVLRDVDPADDTERQRRDELFQRACELVVAELQTRLAAPGARDEARREQERELGRHLDAVGQREQAAQLGARLLAAFREAGCPLDDLNDAQDAALWVAGAALAAGDPRAALEALDEAVSWRPAHGFPELDRLAALAHVDCGELPRARWAFQRWLGASHLLADQVLESLTL